MINTLPAPHLVPSMARVADYDSLTLASMRTDNEQGLTIRGQRLSHFLVSKLGEEVLECVQSSESDIVVGYERSMVLNGLQDPGEGEQRESHVNELGDVLWCLARNLGTQGTSLEVATSWVVGGDHADGTFQQLDEFVEQQTANPSTPAISEALRAIEDDTALFLVARFAVFWSVAHHAMQSQDHAEKAKNQLIATGGALLATLGWIAHSRFGVTLQEVAQRNAYKVCVRNANGSVFGSGDKIDR